MRLTYLFIWAAACAILASAAGCSADSDLADTRAGSAAEGVISLSVSMGSPYVQASGSMTRSPFDGFDNEDDKWGKEGENMESLRVMIVDGDGNVEHNTLFTLSDATTAGKYEFSVRAGDTKTILLFANEGNLSADCEGMEIAGGVQSLSLYLASMKPGTYADTDRLRRLTLALSHNSISDSRRSLRKPLPISAVYTEKIPEGEGVTEREYVMHRAAVKYSFRIVNLSKFAHRLDKLRIDRVADREFAFPDADWVTAPDGHPAISDYRTPRSAAEQEYEYELPQPLELPAGMTEAIEAIPSIYVPEGLKVDSPQRVSLALDGEDLDIWRDLMWTMPGESQAQARPMCDLPRNSHVVVNITISEKGEMSFVADVQPYTSVTLDPWYGLDRDELGNIIVERHEDGTYDVIVDDETITRDQDGDRIVQRFADGSVMCEEIVYKDYIHDHTEIDYIYNFEKDRPGGDMVIIREKTYRGTYHADYSDAHVHGTDDRPVFVLDKEGTYWRVTYGADGTPHLSTTDIKGDEILQANGFQFIDDAYMTKHNLFGTYIVRLASGELELRWYVDGSVRTWPEPESEPKIVAETSGRAAAVRSSHRALPERHGMTRQYKFRNILR